MTAILKHVPCEARFALVTEYALNKLYKNYQNTRACQHYFEYKELRVILWFNFLTLMLLF